MNKKKIDVKIIIIIILSLLVIALGTYIAITTISRKVIDTPAEIIEEVEKNESIENTEDSKPDTEALSNIPTDINEPVKDVKALENYIKIEKIQGPHGSNEKVSFSNLRENLYYNFQYSVSNFVFDAEHRYNDIPDFDVSVSNNITAEVTDKILSVSENEYLTIPYSGKTSYKKTLNINLETQRLMTNKELLEKYGITTTQVYEAIYKDIPSKITTDFLLKSISGNIEADRITTSSLAENATEYAKYADNQYEGFNLYLENGKLCVSYNINDVLNIVCLGNHMGQGIPNLYQTIVLN